MLDECDKDIAKMFTALVGVSIGMVILMMTPILLIAVIWEWIA